MLQAEGIHGISPLENITDINTKYLAQ